MGERRSSQLKFGVALERLLSRANPEQELSRLQDLQNVMITNYDSSEDIEQNWLQNSGGSDYFCQKTPEEVFEAQEHANDFVFYVFDRRYGWTEGGSYLTTSKSSHDARCKATMNELLDEYIKWLVHESYLGILDELLIRVQVHTDVERNYIYLPFCNEVKHEIKKMLR